MKKLGGFLFFAGLGLLFHEKILRFGNEKIQAFLDAFLKNISFENVEIHQLDFVGKIFLDFTIILQNKNDLSLPIPTKRVSINFENKQFTNVPIAKKEFVKGENKIRLKIDFKGSEAMEMGLKYLQDKKQFMRNLEVEIPIKYKMIKRNLKLKLGK